jgi:hypothetical protein
MSEDQDEDNVGYEFEEVDHAVVAITQQLISKVLESCLLNDAERTVVIAIAKELAELPYTPSNLNASLSLIGPRRKFGDHEIYHHWKVEIEGEEIRVGAGGYFYRPSTGGDSFTSFSWVAWPGCETECQDFSSSLRIVDDAKPFGTEIEELDLGEPGYTVSVTIDGESVDEGDELSDDDAEGDGGDDTEPTSSELTVCLWAFLDADLKLIYAVSGRVYRLSGDDESKLQTLRELSRHDFHSVGRSSVPDRFCVSCVNGSRKQGFAPPDAVFDPSAMFFEELLNELEQQLPPLADFARDTQTRQKLPGDPLSVRTVVYEDAHGNCRAIVDKEDKTWLLRQMQ